MFKKILLPALFALSFTTPAGAELTAQAAEQHVCGLAKEAISGAKNDHASFEPLFHKYFDSTYIGRFILGKYWRQATSAEQTEYLKLFTQLVVTSYEKRFNDYNGETLKILETRPAGKDIIVQSTLSDPNASDIKINWRVRDRSKGPKIIDVVVEDISLSVTQRSEFYAIIQNNNNSIEALLKALREKLNGTPESQASFLLPDHSSTPSGEELSLSLPL